jgi:hypothetical protein
VNYKIERFISKIKYILQFREMWSWPYESCDNCGKCYRMVYRIKDETWLKINEKDGGCLCVDCLLSIAQRKKISFSIEDFIHLWVFNPDGGSFDILGEDD